MKTTVNHNEGDLLTAFNIEREEARVIFDQLIDKLESGDYDLTEKERAVYFVNEVVGVGSDGVSPFVRALQFSGGVTLPEELYPSELVEYMVDNVDIKDYVGGN